MRAPASTVVKAAAWVRTSVVVIPEFVLRRRPDLHRTDVTDRRREQLAHRIPGLGSLLGAGGDSGLGISVMKPVRSQIRAGLGKDRNGLRRHPAE